MNTLDAVKRHAICGLAFAVKAVMVTFALAVWLAAVVLGGGAIYIWITQYGWLPMLVTMGCIAGGIVVLIALVFLGMRVIDWAEEASCNL